MFCNFLCFFVLCLHIRIHVMFCVTVLFVLLDIIQFSQFENKQGTQMKELNMIRINTLLLLFYHLRCIVNSGTGYVAEMSLCHNTQFLRHERSVLSHLILHSFYQSLNISVSQ